MDAKILWRKKNMKSFDEEWEKIHSSQEWGKYPVEAVIRFVARNYYRVSSRSDIKVLDYGCGGGAHTWFLAREGFDTYAFDGSKSAIHRVDTLLSKEGLYAHLDVFDANEIEYENNYFDAVIDNVCIYANIIENIQAMYLKIFDILKAGGRLFTSSFSTKTTGYGTGDLLEYNTYRNLTVGSLAGRGTVHFWNEEELYEILKATGFEEIIIEPSEYIDRGCIVSLLNVNAIKPK